MEFWIMQAIGLLGNVIVIGSVQFNNRKVILVAQALACCLWVVHYSYLGALTAVCTNFVSFARSVVFYNNSKRWAQSRWWLALFVGLFVLNSALTLEGWRSIFPGMAMICTTLALWTKDTRKTRAPYFINSPFWLTYDLICGSYSCAVTETIAWISYTLSIWRYDIRGREKSKEA